jgi:hypothetical protein
MKRQRAAVFVAILLWIDLMRPASVIRFFVGAVRIDTTGPQLCAAFTEVGVVLKHIQLAVNRATGKRAFERFLCIV